MGKPLILITNDDGINARGIQHLIQLMNEIGECFVIAPDKPQSGKGHAITIEEPIRYKKLEQYSHPAYSCNGTSADCVKVAIRHLMPRMPDLVVSGINHGSNSSVSVIYSGTMAAVIEAAMEGIPAIGFSLLDHSPEADFKPALPFIKHITEEALTQGIPKHHCINVNIPKTQDIKGVKICRQAKGRWIEEFDVREDPHKRTYLWLKGYFEDLDQGDDTDQHALNNGYVSVVPVQYDLTDYKYLNELKKWNIDV